MADALIPTDDFDDTYSRQAHPGAYDTTGTPKPWRLTSLPAGAETWGGSAGEAPVNQDYLKGVGAATAEDLRALGRAVGPGQTTTAIGEGEAGLPVQAPPITPMESLFGSSIKQGQYNSDTGWMALHDWASDFVPRARTLTGQQLGYPEDFHDQAQQNVDAKIAAGQLPHPGSPEFPLDAVTKESYRLFGDEVQSMINRYPTDTAQGQMMRAELAAGLNPQEAANAFVRNSGAAYQAQYENAKKTGTVLPWLVSTLGEAAGSYRNPYNQLSLAASFAMPEIGIATTAAGRIAEEAARWGLFNVAATGVQEPGIQQRRAELGEENGFYPVLRDLGESFLGGAIPGGVIRGISEVGAIWRGLSDAQRQIKIEEFLQAHSETPPPGVSREEWADRQSSAVVQEFRRQAREWEAQQAAAAKGKQVVPYTGEAEPIRPPMTPGSENIPRTTIITSEAIQAGEDDHAAAGPLPPGIVPGDALGAYEGMLKHAENPDEVAPPVAPPFTPDAPTSPIEPDDVGVIVPRQAERGETIDGKPVTKKSFDPRTLRVDAQTFQFKEGTDAQGVSPRLQGAEQWAPMATGNIVVWERKDGVQFIADGHQRVGFAKRLDAQGALPQGARFDGYLLKEADGWTSADARAVAAKKNIQEASGSPMDIARVLRDRPDMWDKSLPTTDARLKQGKGLAELSDDAWGMVVNGRVRPDYASLVGLGVTDKAGQAAVLEDIIKFKPQNADAVRMIIEDANQLGYRQAASEALLPGFEPITRTLVGQRAQVVGAVAASLRKEAKLFNMLDSHSAEIEEAGNQLVDTNADRGQRAEQLAQILGKLASRTGPVSAALNRAAQKVADGGKVNSAVRDFLGDIDRLVKEEGLKITAPVPRSDIDLDTPQGRAQQTAELMAANENRVPTPEQRAIAEHPLVKQAEEAARAPGLFVIDKPSVRGGTVAPIYARSFDTLDDALAAAHAVGLTTPTVSEYRLGHLWKQHFEPPSAIPADVPAEVFRGSGRTDIGIAYNPMGAAVPIAGPARYYAFSEEVAKTFGPNVERVNTADIVRNPLIIRDGNEWRALTKSAGWQFPNPFGKSQSELSAMTQRLQDIVKSQGHDGIIVSWDESSPYDIGPKGENIKLLREVFDQPQVISFGPHPAVRQIESAIRGAVENAHAALQASATPLDQVVDQAITEHVEPLVEAAFPKLPGIEHTPVEIWHHGTHEFFDRFDARFLGQNTSAVDAIGFHFSSSEDAARGYAEGTAGGRIIKVRLDIRNPLTVNMDELRAGRAAHEIDFEDEKAEIIHDAFDAGHDAVIFANSRDVHTGKPTGTTVVVRDTDQIEQVGQTLGPFLPEAEPTAAGPQTIIPGVAPVTDADRIAAEAAKPLRGGQAPPPEGGLFDEGARRQMDLLDAIATEKGLVPREEYIKQSTMAEAIAKFIKDCPEE